MWFCKKHSVCEKCQVHFEPFKGRHPELCPQHREPVIALEDRIQRVCEWARAHWETLEPQVLEDQKKVHAAMQESFSRMAAMQQNSNIASLGGLGGMFPYNR